MEKKQPVLYVTLTLTDTKTRRVIKRRRFKSRSYLKQMAQILYVHMSASAETIKETDGTFTATMPNVPNLLCAAAVADILKGIVVGTNSTAVTITDFKLGTQIAHGTAADQLSHSAVGFTAPSTNATTTSFTISRTFANNSPGSITVNECGLYTTVQSTVIYCCPIRDIISGGIAVPVGKTLTVTYTIGVTA